MELKFLLQVDGHHGIPDGEWTGSSILESEDVTAVTDAAKLLIQAEYKRFTRSETLPDSMQNLTVKYGSTCLDVFEPGATFGDPLRYTLTPVLVIGKRAFILTEAEI